MKSKLAQVIATALQGSLTIVEVEALLETPKHAELGDVAFPCFTLAKKFKKSPQIIANELAGKIQGSFIQEVRVENAYINIFFNQLKIAQDV
ncbi:MAG: arginine--tRNA ligase, partial [Solibacillus sp.]